MLIIGSNDQAALIHFSLCPRILFHLRDGYRVPRRFGAQATARRLRASGGGGSAASGHSWYGQMPPKLRRDRQMTIGNMKCLMAEGSLRATNAWLPQTFAAIGCAAEEHQSPISEQAH
jgi:hypothetical protein